jgi:hypothetical protein
MEEKDKKDPMQHLIDAIANSGSKMTFGLQPKHIEAIEMEIDRWNNIKIESDDTKIDMKFSKHVWDKLGKELGWCPFTLCLYYFEYLEDKKNM